MPTPYDFRSGVRTVARYNPGKYMRKRSGQAYKRRRQLASTARRNFRSARYNLQRFNQRSGGYLGIELKFLDTAWTSVAIDQTTDGSGIELQPTAGCTGAISVPAQGDGESNRDGRKYTVKSIFFSGQIRWAAESDQVDVDDWQPAFFALVLDTQANGATVNSEDVFINPSTSALAMLPQPLRNLQFSKRFRVLDHAMIAPGGAYSMTDGASTSSISPMVAKTVKLSWKGNVVCDSTGTTANVSAAADNAFHIIACVGATTPGTPSFTGKCRMRFVG